MASKSKPKARPAKSKKQAKRPKVSKVSKASKGSEARRLERIRLAREEAAEQAEQRRLRPALNNKLANALELAQEMAREIGHPSTLKLASPMPATAPNASGPPGVHPVGGAWQSPWVIIGRFVWHRKPPMTYDDLFAVFTRWQQKRLENKIDSHRLAKIAVTYIDGATENRDDYQLGAFAPWSTALAQAREHCDKTDKQSLAARYGKDGRKGQSAIESVYIWLSANIAPKGIRNEIKLRKPKRR